jgi:tetratricopeptide (TPR) repeat protein
VWPWSKNAALERALKKLESDPENERLLREVEALYRESGNLEAAGDIACRRAAVFESSGFLLKAVAVYRDTLKADPERAAIRERLVEQLTRLGLTTDAIEQCRVLLARYDETGNREGAARVADTLAKLGAPP